MLFSDSFDGDDGAFVGADLCEHLFDVNVHHRRRQRHLAAAQDTVHLSMRRKDRDPEQTGNEGSHDVSAPTPRL